MKSKKINIIHIIAAIGGKMVGQLYPPVGRKSDYILNWGDPNALLDPNTSAQLLRRKQIDTPKFLSNSSAAGFNKTPALQLYQLTENLIQIGDLTGLRLRGEIGKKDYLNRAEKIGIIPENAEKIFNLTQRRLDPIVLVQALWRKLGIGKNEEAVKQELRDQGWSEERMNTLLETAKFYPSAQDLILWQAREVYETDAIEKYGLKDELDRLEKEPFYKAGIDDSQIANYWMAHWQHPEWQTIRQMLFRTDLTEKDVWEWFRLVEIPPYWRDKLIEIMYQPFTRVDVRRMNKIGVLNREETKRAYLDLGFNEDKAEKMTAFTELYNADPEDNEKTEEDKRKDELRGLTRTAIIKQFQQELIPEEEAKSYLLDIGMTEEVAQAYLDLATYSEEEDRIDNYLRVFKRMYLNDVIDFNNLSDELDKLNLPATYKDHLITLWDLEKIGKASIPSKTELGNFLKKDIIDQETYIANMSSLGYSEKFIGWYLQVLGVEVKT